MVVVLESNSITILCSAVYTLSTRPSKSQSFEIAHLDFTRYCRPFKKAEPLTGTHSCH